LQPNLLLILYKSAKSDPERLKLIMLTTKTNEKENPDTDNSDNFLDINNEGPEDTDS
jgi:hypothetical protein